MSFVLLGLLAASLVVGCRGHGGTRHVICDYAQDSGTFVGRVVKIDGPTVTYFVEKLKPVPAGEVPRRNAPVPGKTVFVRYDQQEQRYLHVGNRYTVTVWSFDGYMSGVHHSDAVCSTGTVHADGSAIDTSAKRR